MSLEELIGVVARYRSEDDLDQALDKAVEALNNCCPIASLEVHAADRKRAELYGRIAEALAKYGPQTIAYDNAPAGTVVKAKLRTLLRHVEGVGSVLQGEPRLFVEFAYGGKFAIAPQHDPLALKDFAPDPSSETESWARLEDDLVRMAGSVRDAIARIQGGNRPCSWAKRQLIKNLRRVFVWGLQEVAHLDPAHLSSIGSVEGDPYDQRNPKHRANVEQRLREYRDTKLRAFVKAATDAISVDMSKSMYDVFIADVRRADPLAVRLPWGVDIPFQSQIRRN